LPVKLTHTSANLVDVILLTCRCHDHYDASHKKRLQNTPPTLQTWFRPQT